MNESILQQFNCVSCYFIAFFTVFLTLFMSSPSSHKKLESPLELCVFQGNLARKIPCLRQWTTLIHNRRRFKLLKNIAYTFLTNKPTVFWTAQLEAHTMSARRELDCTRLLAWLCTSWIVDRDENNEANNHFSSTALLHLITTQKIWFNLCFLHHCSGLYSIIICSVSI